MKWVWIPSIYRIISVVVEDSYSTCDDFLLMELSQTYPYEDNDLSPKWLRAYQINPENNSKESFGDKLNNQLLICV